MKEVFDTYIDNAFSERKQADFKFEQFEFNYKKYFPNNKNAKVLDIGVGRGEMLSLMKKWGYENYLGLDISPSTIEFCKTLNLNCELTNDTIKWLSEHPGEFEMITLLDVLEHVKREEIISMLRALRGALSMNGKLIIQVPNLQAPDGHLHMYNDITHEVGFIEHSLSQVLIVAGFSSVEFGGFEEVFVGKRRSIKLGIIYVLRSIYWRFVRFQRLINSNINPKILTPVFYAVVKK